MTVSSQNQSLYFLESSMIIRQKALVVAAVTVVVGASQAGPVFQGRLADGTASSTCTVSGRDKCSLFYDVNLDITILNDWNIGPGVWDISASPGSVQAMVEAAGIAATGLTGWVLPTGNLMLDAGPENQYLSIWNDVGRSFTGLRGQFDGVQATDYWAGTKIMPYLLAYQFYAVTSFQTTNAIFAPDHYAVAVRPGDVLRVPEPATLALVAAALLGVLATRTRKPKSSTA